MSEDGERIVGDSSVVSVGVKKDGELTSASQVTDGAGFEGICDYSTTVVEDIADKLFAGNFDKTPKVYAGKQHTPCDYCEYKPVCRFNEAAGKEKKIFKDKTGLSGQIAEIKGVMDNRDKPEIKRAEFYNTEEG